MPQLLKDGAVAEDAWVRADDEDALPAEGGVIVSLERWQAERESLRGRNAPVGVALSNDQDPRQLADDLRDLDLIQLTFPAYTDGRAYSQARLLRQRMGFEGEIRAAGNVLIDQYPLMLRCGFDAFEVKDDTDAQAWEKATKRISAEYQPAADGVRAVWAKRHGIAESA